MWTPHNRSYFYLEHKMVLTQGNSNVTPRSSVREPFQLSRRNRNQANLDDRGKGVIYTQTQPSASFPAGPLSFPRVNRWLIDATKQWFIWNVFRKSLSYQWQYLFFKLVYVLLTFVVLNVIYLCLNGLKIVYCIHYDDVANQYKGSL